MAERAARYRDVFGVAEFRYLFGAHLLSVIGDQFARLALTVIVFQRTASAGLAALTYALTFLPDLVGGPLLSGLADRYPRRQVMIVADVARAALVGLMALPGVPLALLWALLISTQLLASPFNAARAATLPAALTGDRYHIAVSLSNMTYQLAQLAGLALAGVLLTALNPTTALLVDALTFLASAALVRLGVHHRPAPVDCDSPPRWWPSVLTGAHLIRTNPRLRLLVYLLCLCAAPVAAEGLAVPYAGALTTSPAAAAILMASGPAGAFVGMASINRLAPARRNAAMFPLAFLAGAALIPCLAAPGLASSVILWTVSGAAMAYLVPANAELVVETPDKHRAQVFGLAVTAMRAAQGVAVLLAGGLASLTKPHLAVGIAGVIGAVLAAYGWLRQRRTQAATPSTSP